MNLEHGIFYVNRNGRRQEEYRSSVETVKGVFLFQGILLVLK